MSLVNFLFRPIVCGDCGEVSPVAEILSYNTIAPPPAGYSYDGKCIHCGSINTEEKVLNDKVGRS